MDLEERRNELNNRIELSCGFEEIDKNLEEFEEMESKRSNRKPWGGNRKSTTQHPRRKWELFGEGVLWNWGK